MAEIELNILQRQCLSQRFADRAALEREIAAWAATRTTITSCIDWQFTVTDARTKLRRLYPAYAD